MMPGGSIAPNIMFAAFGWLIVVIKIILTSVESSTFFAKRVDETPTAEEICMLMRAVNG